jgi:hypothetical protein
VNNTEEIDAETSGIREFRALVAFWLSFALGRAVRIRGPRTRGPRPSSHLVGVPGVAFNLSGAALTRIPKVLSAAQLAAENDGSDIAVAVMRRRGRPIGEALAVLTAKDFARLLARCIEPDDDAGDTAAAVVARRPY